MVTKDESRQFSDLFVTIDRVYDLYAKSIGVSSMGLCLLYHIFHEGVCTQTYLSELLVIPRQTVNSIVKLYQEQGLLELVELPGDRRQRGLQLTAQGLAFAQRHVLPIDRAEQRSIAQFDPEDRQKLAELLQRYVDTLQASLL